MVDVKGTIHRLPSLRILRNGWKLNRDQLHFFGQQQIYVAAEYVRAQNQRVTIDSAKRNSISGCTGVVSLQSLQSEEGFSRARASDTM